HRRPGRHLIIRGVRPPPVDQDRTAPQHPGGVRRAHGRQVGGQVRQGAGIGVHLIPADRLSRAGEQPYPYAHCSLSMSDAVLLTSSALVRSRTAPMSPSGFTCAATANRSATPLSQSRSSSGARWWGWLVLTAAPDPAHAARTRTGHRPWPP